MGSFTIGVLLYGDYPQLAERCLRSIAATVKATDLNLRVGLNQVSPRVSEWVKSWVPSSCIWEYPKNINKYPLFREMIHGATPVETDYFMWFDDDSWLEGYERGSTNQQPYWLQLVDHAMTGADMIGSLYTMDFQGNQRDWLKTQSWYGGKDPANRKIRFATGGWWTIKTEILYKYNYPWPELDHNGGDTLLGELCLQQDLRLQQFRKGVKINASDDGRESKSERRGTSQRPLGYDFKVTPTSQSRIIEL